MIKCCAWKRWLLLLMCFLPPVVCFVVVGQTGPLLEAGVLNSEDLTVAGGRRGTLRQELLNVWTWDAVGGLSCVLSLFTVPVGIMLWLGRLPLRRGE
jgi:hypothetical protein